jgi:hypothetical protein
MCSECVRTRRNTEVVCVKEERMVYAWVGYCNSPLNKRILIIITVVFSLIGFPHKLLCKLCV